MSRVVLPGRESYFSPPRADVFAELIEAGYVRLMPQDAVNEGGQIELTGAGVHTGFAAIDRFQNRVRILSGANAPMQWDNSGTFADLPVNTFVSGDLKVRAGTTPASPTTETYLELKVDTTLRRVSVDAVDTAGTGFRGLRVPNA